MTLPDIASTDLVRSNKSREYRLMMSVYCDWCGASFSGITKRCSGCSILAKSFLGLSNSQLPTDEGRSRMNSLLAKHRGLSDEQRLSAFIRECESIPDLPYGLRPPEPDNVTPWSEKACSLWMDAYREIRARGKLEPCALPVPGGGILIIEEDDTITLDGIVLTDLPLHDLALWLSNPQRADVVSDWKMLILSLACSCRGAWMMDPEEWAKWVVSNSWSGIDTPALELCTPCIDNIQPIFEFIALQCDVPDENRYTLGHFARQQSSMLESIGGLASESWGEILDSETETIGKLFDKQVLPKLVTIDYRLHLLVLKDGKPYPIRVAVDSEIWRTLIAWTFEPPGTDGAERLSYLFWCWNGENEDWVPTERQIRSSRMLRGAIESLGEDSSLEPVTYTENTNGLFVRGKSGLAYLILPRVGGSKFMVEAIPDVEFVDRAFQLGMLVCIEEEGESSLPAGDIAVSYLLALRDDIQSSKLIHTLSALLDTVGFTNRKDGESTMQWWSRVGDNYGNWVEGIDGEYEEGYPDDYDEFYEEMEDDPPELPEIDFELPAPGDYSALAEALENAAIQARQLQGGSE